MECSKCRGKGKVLSPEDQNKFYNLVDVEMEKGYFVSQEIAEKTVLKKYGFTFLTCPVCKGCGQVGI